MKNSIKDTVIDTIRSDEQAQVNTNYQGINWVGMSAVQSVVAEGSVQVPALVDMYVNLNSGSRGIHMSRLYVIHQENFLGKPLSSKNLSSILQKFVSSQEGLSHSARINVKYQSLVQTQSLKSGVSGFRTYPVQIEATLKNTGEMAVVVQFEVTYSSTCPQSAKLSKEFFKNTLTNYDQLHAWYDSDQIYPATPHAQRSVMKVSLDLNPMSDLDVQALILQTEQALKTTVQTAVKKSDEMEFARLNAENTMFCEDAVRLVAENLDKNKIINGYKLEANHLESLHSHNASSILVKNFNCN